MWISIATLRCVAGSGNKDMSMDSNFLSGNAFIIDGRMIKKVKKMSVSFSKSLQIKPIRDWKQNKFGNCRDKEDSMTYDVEVVGIYQVNQSNSLLICLEILTGLKILFYRFGFLKRWMENLAIHYMRRHISRLLDVKEYETVKTRGNGGRYSMETVRPGLTITEI